MVRRTSRICSPTIVVLLVCASSACNRSDPAGDATAAGQGRQSDGGSAPPRRSPIAAENQRPGGLGYRLDAPSSEIAAYASRASAAPGDDVIIHAGASSATTGSWELWRIGHYGGSGGRKILDGQQVAIARWTAPVLDPATGAVCANWPATFRLTLPQDAVTGVYLVRISSPIGQTYATFVVREPSPAAAIVYPVSTNTYQAYNPWGGTSLYENNRNDWSRWHAFAVCLDRPYQQNHGQGELLDKDRDFITFAEAQGLDLAYVSDVDVDADPALLMNRRMIVIQGHSEYWTRPMRDGVEDAIAAGVNVAFLGANTAYWQVRFADGSRRMLIGYKEFSDLDPARVSDPAHLTTRWRDPPLNRPESRMIGEMFGAWLWVAAPLQVRDPSAWIWTGTGVDGDSLIPGAYADEVDHRSTPENEPEGVSVFGGAFVEGHDGVFSGGEMTFYTAPSGAQVFCSGSINWSHALAGYKQWDPRAQQATANLFSVFAGDGALPAPLQPMQLPPGAPAPVLRKGAQVVRITTALSAPAAVAAMPNGDAVVVDGHRLVRVTRSGSVSPIAGSAAGMTDGPVETAKFFRPHGVAVDGNGTIYVADTGNSRIRAIRGGTVRTVAGSAAGFADGVGAAAAFDRPMALTLTPSGSLLVADTWNQRVREVRPDGTVITWAGTGARGYRNGPGAVATFTFPLSIAVLPGGDLAVVEPESGMLRTVSAAGRHEVGVLAGSLGAMGWEDGPAGVATLAETLALSSRPGGEIVLIDGATARIRALRAGSTDTLAIGFHMPRGIAAAADGGVWVVDAADHSLSLISSP